ncbi:MAG: cyclic nucleotide-binding domain-containing protein [Vicinamibacteria bacterium]
MTGTSADHKRIAEHLKTSPLFAGLDSSSIERLADICRVERVVKGRAIVEEGSLGESMFVLMRGRVRVEKMTPAEDRYTVTFLSDEKGDFFGELGLLDSDRRSATVTAETECEVIEIERDRFLEFGNANPTAGLSVTRRIAGNLASRLRRANDDVITLFAALVHEVEERI